MMLRILLLILGFVVIGPLETFGQQFESVAGTAVEAKEAFAENAPMANVKMDDSFFNGREQRLREHYLEVPIGPLPEIRAMAEAGEAMPDQTPLPRQGLAEAGSIIVQNRELSDIETGGSTSGVCEPSLAVRGQEILVTGNWFACISKDGGTSFQYRNPYSMFPPIGNRPFCCDQVALYVPSHDLMVWFLQHGSDNTGNTVRLAVAQGADIAAERWRYYDFTPQSVGNWTGEWFDYPDLSFSKKFLFVTTNCFSLQNQFRRSVAIRIPLDELKAYAAINYRYFDKTDVGSLKLAASIGDSMFIGTHKNLGELRVFKWADDQSGYTGKDFAVQPWIRGSASAAGPDGRDWLGFVDGRITAGWSSGDTQGFAWTSGQGGTFGQPHVRVARLNWEAGTVVGQPHIWNSGFAFAYPSATTSGDRPVAVSVAYGGGNYYPGHSVGFLNSSGSSWDLTATANGNYGPERNRWGDYFNVRVNGGDENRFATVGYTQSGGPARTDVVPRLVQFQFSSPEPWTNDPVPESSVIVPDPSGMAGDQETAQLKIEQMIAAIEQEPDVKGKFDKRRPEKAAADSKTTLMLESPFTQNRIAGAVKTVLQFNPDSVTDQDRDFLELPPVSAFAYDRPESVCLPDDRQQVLDTLAAPFDANCQLIITLNDGSRAVGTGWFAGPRCVITAGHCVHEGDGGNFFRSVEVIPGMNGLNRPFGSKTSTRFRATEQWINQGIQGLDYGAILLDEEFAAVNGQVPGTYSARVLSDPEFAGLQLSISGYPADKPNGTQWFGFGPIATLQPERIRYMIDTFGGHSGSAVTFSENGKAVVVGIHNYGGCPNKCTRITSEVMSNIDAWLQESTAAGSSGNQESRASGQ